MNPYIWSLNLKIYIDIDKKQIYMKIYTESIAVYSTVFRFE